MSPRTDSDISVTADLLPGLERGGHASGDARPDVKVRLRSEASIKSKFGRALSRKNIKEEEEEELSRLFSNVLQFSSEYTATLGYQTAYAQVTSDGYARDRQSTKHEVGTLDVAVDGNSLGNSVMMGPWSPGSSAQSPILSAGSRAPSEGLEPLIQSGYIEGIQLWQHQIKLAQGSIRPPDKMDRRRCPQCNKVFRRPSSLDDHLDVHSGAKRKLILGLVTRLLTELTAHMCPFKNCRTGFATKSNMKRHFLTHRVGTLEEYSSGRTKAVHSQSRTTTYNSRAFHTQRSRLAN
ncbi:Zinc finger protein [Ceratobasidium theobromae]|uniref:Zinc finger protein n=1 Tax=Ceratobasidium theobromae TaxID=1582974 RepID=A0A5N5QIW9_9AGAM|nr:Zinc finger protein [Ceratobasidium theobromae]